MNKKTYLLGILLSLVLLLFTGCAGKEERTVRKAVKSQLEQLKESDASAVQACIHASGLLPAQAQDDTLYQNLADIFALFYQDFSYRIKDVTIKDDSATVTATFKTIDAKTLAKDFSKAALKKRIEASASSSSEEFDLEQSYLLLKDLMKSKEYGTTSLTAEIKLARQDETWEIIATSELDSALTGNFLEYATDSKLLSPKEIVKLHFDSIKDFSPEQLRVYLCMDHLLETDEQYEDSLGEAMAKQISKHFNYKILEETTDNTQAVVRVSVSSVDFSSILSSYKKKASKWLKTSDALAAGADGRKEKERSILLSCIQKNKATVSQEVDIHLINDGVSWKIQMDSEITNAVFGDAQNAIGIVSQDVE